MKILIADTDEPQSKSLGAKLSQWAHSVHTVHRENDLLESIKKSPPELLILADNAATINAEKICLQIRDSRTDPADDDYIYIILLTDDQPRMKMSTLVDDTIKRNADADELRLRLHFAKRIRNLHSQLTSVRKTYGDLVLHDSLTGLWNRQALLEKLAREISRCERNNSPLCVAMADLDHFKKINDTHGHPAGDVVLRAAAERMQSVLRPYDAIGRYGGEEFVVVLPECDMETGLKIVERIRDAVADEPFNFRSMTEHNGNEIAQTVTVSIGLALHKADEKMTVEDILLLADKAMYKAKRAGRNTVEI